MMKNTETQECYCDALEDGIICPVCEEMFFGIEVEEIELDEVW
jgi:hypothetical protein